MTITPHNISRLVLAGLGLLVAGGALQAEAVFTNQTG